MLDSGRGAQIQTALIPPILVHYSHEFDRQETRLNDLNNDQRFEIQCDAGDAGRLHARTNSVSVRVGQRIRRNGAPEIWDSVIILCQETEDGKLSTKVIVCHPDWEQHLQIAHIQSRVTEANPSIPALEFDLKPVHI